MTSITIPDPEAPAQIAAPRAYEPERDQRPRLSEWFARPAPSEEQLAELRRRFDEAKAAYVDADDKLVQLSAEVRRFTRALTEPTELESIVASAQAAEVKARVLGVGIAADEAQRVLKAAQKRFDFSVTAAREAELVLPDVQAMVVEQRRVVEQKSQVLSRAGYEMGLAAFATVLHGSLRSQLTSLLATFLKLNQIEDEFEVRRPFRFKLEHPSGGTWFLPEEINAQA